MASTSNSTGVSTKSALKADPFQEGGLFNKKFCINPLRLNTFSTRKGTLVECPNYPSKRSSNLTPLNLPMRTSTTLSNTTVRDGLSLRLAKPTPEQQNYLPKQSI